MKKMIMVLSLSLGLLLVQASAKADDYCLGQTSAGNPYSCFGNGNCVWWCTSRK